MREIKKDKKKSGNNFVYLCLLQTIAVLIICACVFFAARVNASLFSEIKQEFSNLMREDFDIGGYFSSLLKEKNKSKDKILTAQDTALKEEGFASEAENFKSEKLTVTPNESLGVDSDAFSFYSSDAVMPANGVISSDYGYRIHPIYFTESFHAGRDIAAPEGNKIYAALDGAVIEEGVGKKAGKYIKIGHADGVETLYCHCSAIYAKKGMKVRKGDVIALIGHTGLATGPHLHFEYRVNHESKNPEILLSKAKNVY